MCVCVYIVSKSYQSAVNFKGFKGHKKFLKKKKTQQVSIFSGHDAVRCLL